MNKLATSARSSTNKLSTTDLNKLQDPPDGLAHFGGAQTSETKLGGSFNFETPGGPPGGTPGGPLGGTPGGPGGFSLTTPGAY